MTRVVKQKPDYGRSKGMEKEEMDTEYRWEILLRKETEKERYMEWELGSRAAFLMTSRQGRIDDIGDRGWLQTHLSG